MKKRYKALLSILGLIAIGFLIPEPKCIPVMNATESDWNSNSFWYEPWGTSGVHKGIDIFAGRGVPVLSSTNLLILYRGTVAKGGQVILGLGPKWRLHYFAHMDSLNVKAGYLIPAGTDIGRVGDSGNAKGKQPHLHFSILSLIPLPWLMDGSTQGFKKAFYINPLTYFMEAKKSSAT